MPVYFTNDLAYYVVVPLAFKNAGGTRELLYIYIHDVSPAAVHRLIDSLSTF